VSEYCTLGEFSKEGNAAWTLATLVDYGLAVLGDDGLYRSEKDGHVDTPAQVEQLHQWRKEDRGELPVTKTSLTVHEVRQQLLHQPGGCDE
jgi:hypothetical protein